MAIVLSKSNPIDHIPYGILFQANAQPRSFAAAGMRMNWSLPGRVGELSGVWNPVVWANERPER